jgi:hypothetical protein
MCRAGFVMPSSSPAASPSRSFFTSSGRQHSEALKAREYLRYSVDVNRSSDSSFSSRKSIELRRSTDSAPLSATLSRRNSRQWFRGFLDRPSVVEAREAALAEPAVMRAPSPPAASQVQ